MILVHDSLQLKCAFACLSGLFLSQTALERIVNATLLRMYTWEISLLLNMKLALLSWWVTQDKGGDWWQNIAKEIWSSRWNVTIWQPVYKLHSTLKTTSVSFTLSCTPLETVLWVLSSDTWVECIFWGAFSVLIFRGKSVQFQLNVVKYVKWNWIYNKQAKTLLSEINQSIKIFLHPHSSWPLKG